MKVLSTLLLTATTMLFACSPQPERGWCPVSGGDHLYYEVKGSGTPVILLHGHSLDTRMWDGQFNEFAKDPSYRPS